MTNNKTVFMNWYKHHYPDNFIRSVKGTSLVEIEAIPSGFGKAYTGPLDPNYVTCLVKDMNPKAGNMYDGTEGHIFVFIGKTASEAIQYLIQPEPRRSGKQAEGKGAFVPTSINAFLKWCERNNVNILSKQRLPNCDPAQFGLRGLQRAYYYCEISNTDIERLDFANQLLTHVPHKAVDSERTMLLLTAPDNKKQNKLDKALRQCILFRTEQYCIYYAELFLQRHVNKVDISKIDWNGNVGMEIINAVTAAGSSEVGRGTEKEENNGQNVGNQLPDETSTNVPFDF
jgi:hypothetical protein